jgi:hypothetical protein
VILVANNDIAFKNGWDKFESLDLNDIKAYIVRHGDVRFIDRIDKSTKEIQGAELKIDYNESFLKDVNIDETNEFWKACKQECKNVAKLLREDKCSRQAIVDFMPISPENLPSCFVCAQFFANKKNVDMFVYMRSCDAVNKLASDLARYCIMNKIVADLLGLKPKEITIFIGSLHIYVDDIIRK